MKRGSKKKKLLGGEGSVGGGRRPNPEGRFIINQEWRREGERGWGKAPRKGGDEERERSRREGVSQSSALLLLETERGATGRKVCVSECVHAYCINICVQLIDRQLRRYLHFPDAAESQTSGAVIRFKTTKKKILIHFNLAFTFWEREIMTESLPTWNHLMVKKQRSVRGQTSSDFTLSR